MCRKMLIYTEANSKSPLKKGKLRYYMLRKYIQPESVLQGIINHCTEGIRRDNVYLTLTPNHTVPGYFIRARYSQR